MSLLVPKLAVDRMRSALDETNLRPLKKTSGVWQRSGRQAREKRRQQLRLLNTKERKHDPVSGPQLPYAGLSNRQHKAGDDWT